jgi:hypothetical protein
MGREEEEKEVQERPFGGETRRDGLFEVENAGWHTVTQSGDFRFL